MTLPKNAVFVIAHSQAYHNKASTGDYNLRVAECRLAAQVLHFRRLLTGGVLRCNFHYSSVSAWNKTWITTLPPLAVRLIFLLLRRRVYTSRIYAELHVALRRSTETRPRDLSKTRFSITLHTRRTLIDASTVCPMYSLAFTTPLIPSPSPSRLSLHLSPWSFPKTLSLA